MKTAQHKNGESHLAAVEAVPAAGAPSEPEFGHSAVRKFMEHSMPLSAPQDKKLPASAIFCHIAMLDSVLKRAANRCAERYEMTMPQWLALGFIGHTGREGITHSQLGQRLMLSKAPITGLVDRLERDGYVLRAGDQKDRRVSRIRITPKGEETWLRVREGLRECTSSHCAGLSSEEQQTLLSLLARLLDGAAQADPLLENIDD
jgi:MarR family transcriptional regulator, 2-MHQ and catechol-resistance regulon repressor